jgi:glycosyltransferase involved in cell wall biosynthesis
VNYGIWDMPERHSGLMKILHAHNFYKQPGGEDTAFRSETALLRDHGHQVVEFTDHNRRIGSLSPFSLALQTVWSWDTYRRLREILLRDRPDLVHFHNTFPLISPSAYSACRSLSIPVIQSLDNPRLLCPSANFFRAGRLCRDCLGKTPPFPGVWHRCYHHSCAQTAVVAAMLSIHRWRRTWQTQVDAFLVATEFYRRKFIEGGLPAAKLFVKPHFLYQDPGVRSAARPGGYALFAGRLDPEKGVATLLAAWERLPEIPLKIRGEGRMASEVQAWIRKHGRNNVETIGLLSRSELTDLIKGARFFVWPSEGYYETFGYVAVESFSCGVPVLTSRIGVQEETVSDGGTGWHFQPGDVEDLAAKAAWAWDHPSETAALGRAARKEYEKKYTAQEAYPLLMDIYNRTLASNGRRAA